MKTNFLTLCMIMLVPLFCRAQSICSVINYPGYYAIGANLPTAPTDPNDAAICITVSDVTFDLNGFAISQINSVTGFVAINVDPNLTNIIIQNGVINDVTDMGIVIGEGCSEITISDITVLNSPGGGILLNGTSISPIQNGSISNCVLSTNTGVDSGPAYGLRLLYCNEVSITDCTFNSNDAGTVSSGFGASAENCTTCKFINCDAANNGGNDLGVGINIFNSDWILVQNCRVTNTIGRTLTGKGVGILLNSANNTTVLDCIEKHTNNALGFAYGYEAINGTNNLFDTCYATNNVASTTASGFMLDGTEVDSSIKNCNSRSNSGGSSGIGYGIAINGPQSCDILFNIMTDNSGLTAYGLVDTTVDTTNLIAGNIADDNTTAGFNVNRTVGTFPVLSASPGDFSAINSTSKYLNIDFGV